MYGGKTKMRVRTRKISQSCTSPKKHGGNKEEKKMREFLKSTNQGVRKKSASG